MRMLLIEDDQYIAEFILKGLREELYIVDHASDGEKGLDLAKTGNYDLMILDVMLPKINGIEICKEIRKSGIQSPVLMLTAKNTIKDKVAGLECGADDYVTKPFSFDEFLARLRALCRRIDSKIIELRCGDLRIDALAHRVFINETELTLRPKEYAVLYYLISNKGRVLTRTQILENVWGYNYDPATNIVDVYIKSIRAITGPLLTSRLIRTVRGTGYMIEGNPSD